MSDEVKSLQDKVRELGPWFHQLDLGQGVKTRSIAGAPGPQPLDHPLPRWEKVRDVLPRDMHGMRVLDIGCSDGFFSVEMVRRGARVLAVDSEHFAIRRFRWVVRRLGLSGIVARSGDVYDCRKGYSGWGALKYQLHYQTWRVANRLSRRRAQQEDFTYAASRFDLVFMFALLYHLPEPLVALEKLAALSDILFIETIAEEDEAHAHLRYEAPMAGVTTRPKWIPTTRCLKDMLHWAGYQELLQIAGSEDHRPIYLAYKRSADLSRWNLPAQ